MSDFISRPKLWICLTGILLVTMSCSQFSPLALPTEPAVASATPTPLPSIPPVVTDFSPHVGEEVPATDSLIALHFDQDMERASVEKALQVSPEVTGDFFWQNSRTLQFRPKELAAATRYRVFVGTGARSAKGLPLNHELAFNFSTLGPLEVTRTSPENEATDLRSDAPLLIFFNRPVVPLNCTGQLAAEVGDCALLPLAITPRIKGNGSWLNTSLYRFDPRPGWDAGQSYTVRLATGVTSVAGAVLDKPYEWTFGTALPRILEVSPSQGERDLLLETGVRVAFSTPMDPEATGSAFSLVAETGEPVPGAITWEDEGALLIFTPMHNLTLGTRYTARVDERARALTGALLESPLLWEFETVPYPDIVSLTPNDGARGVETYESLRITFQGAISETDILPYVHITPTAHAEDIYTYWYWNDNIFNLSWDKEPRTEYCVTISPGIHDRYGNEIQETTESCFTTGDLQSLFSPATSMNFVTLDTAETPLIYFLARNIGRTSFYLAELQEENFFTSDPGGTSLRKWDATFKSTPNKTRITPVQLTRRGGPLDTGYYNLSWTAPGKSGWRTGLRIAVVDRHLTLKLAAEEAVVWVTDLRSGEPVTNTEVHLLSSNATLLAAATTDDDGIARIPISHLHDLWNRVAAVVGTPGQAGFGVTMNDWNQGASPWDFDIPMDYGPFVPHNLYLYSDRPIYRPGQTIYARGILRGDKDVHYTLPDTGHTVKLELRNPDWDIIYTTTAELSDLGGFDCAVDLPTEAQVGPYMLQASLPEVPSALDHTWDLPLTVAAYRKPEFEVTVTPELDDVLQGKTVRALVEASYFFGGPVSNVHLHWEVRAAPYHFAPPLEGWWSWGRGGSWYRQPEPETIATGEAVTDAQGRFLLELPAELQPLGDETEPASQRWTVEATVTDESGFPVSGRGELTVHATRFYMGLQPRRWVIPAGKQSTVDLQALDWAGDPVAEQEVTATLAQRAWYRIPATQAFMPPSWGYTDTVVSTFNVTTGAQGQAELVVTPPQGGSYVLHAETHDADERPVYAETSLWVSGPEGAAWQMAEGKITPVADAKSYRPGDTASILVPTPFDGPFQVLMTVERGSILEVRRFIADKANPLVELPILENYAPNVYVSFVVVKAADEETQTPPDVRVGLVELTVEPVAQTLAVEIIPDRSTTYTPGDKAELTVRTVDAEGRTVDAEVGLAVVDKAVLSLLEPNAPSILEGFYGERPLSVLTGDSLLTLFSRMVAELEGSDKAVEIMADELTVGGRGGGGGGAPPQPDVRQEFPDTAFWETRVRTGPEGEVQVSVPLPDSLTTWVADARAVTADTKVGEAQAELVVSKPLLVRPVTPRFFVAGDQPEVAAVVHNNTTSELAVNVTLEAAGLSLNGGAAVQAVRIPAGGRVRLTWPLSVPPSGSDTALLTFSAEGSGYQDATRPTVSQLPNGALPIYRYETPDVMGTTGVLAEAGSRVEAIAVPPQAGTDTALTVRLEPSLAAGMTGGLTYLENYPYGCTEQIVSRFLPNVLTYRALRDSGLNDPALERKLQTLVPEALEQLYGRQHSDGGWGWWQSSDLQVSTYATLGLWEAQQADFAVQKESLTRALDYLAHSLSSELDLTTRTWTPNHALALYVLTAAGERWPEGVAESLYASRERLGVAGQASLALALGLADDADPRVITLLDTLRGAAEVTATGAHWESADARYWDTDVRATALALESLVRLAPDDPLLPQVVRWLMLARRGDRWATTQETAWSLIALTDSLVASGELEAEYSWGLALNGEALGNGNVTAENLREVSETRIGLAEEGVARLLRNRTNALEIARGEGGGNLYYTAHLALYQAVESVTAASRGITVQREYCAVEDDAAGDLTACVPVETVAPGELVEVRLTLIVPQTRYYLVLESPYPAGMEPVNPVLLTEQQEQPEPGLLPGEGYYGWWWDPFDHRELRDERAVFFAQALPAGTYQVHYRLRAAVPGEYRVLPSTASEMYFPEVWGRTDGATFRVEP